MITVTMPEWFTWFLLFIVCLVGLNSLLGLWCDYLRLRLQRMKNETNH
jgi:hypothetical protein